MADLNVLVECDGVLHRWNDLGRQMPVIGAQNVTAHIAIK